ncbi:glycosyltransferase [Streptomyces sp. AM 4-1-1]|uniref:glycosyltransferase family 4 protein n=1 Tax=Streptomyces sp. AM 4-1-1 TaxID=3028710 RepID=UPI0023B9D40A|nr:glycosyltransferase [Streptomyces sp. AM 4-1-1]WEH33349.1 glycosyltransferase [Streptomyces sp. AM 4-1-1]
MTTSVARPKLAVIVANGITGDSRVQKTALAAARAGWDVMLIGQSVTKRQEHSWFGPVKVVRVPVVPHMKRRVAAQARRGGPRARLTQFGIKDRGTLHQVRAAHGTWVREQTAKIGWWGSSGVAAPAAASLKAWVRARRGVHKLRVKAYRWEERRKPEQQPTGDWRKDWPGLLDLDLAFGPVIEKFAPDVIHANDITAINLGAMAAARLRARGRKCAWLYDAHEYVAGVEWPNPLMTTAFPGVEKEFIHRADAVVTVSPEIAEVIRKDYGLAKTPLVVRNTPIRETIGTAGGRVSVRAACGLGDDVPLLVYSGWISSERGLGTAVEGLAQLPDYHLAIVAGKRSPELLRLLELAEETGVRDRIHVVPYVAQHEVADYLSTADLGLICSQRTINYELSLPTKTAEYLHAGLPIIASDVKTLSAFVREHGVGEVFVSGDADSFSEAVTRGIDKLAEMKAHITEPILTELSWEHQCEGLMELYTKISGVTPPTPRSDFSWGAVERVVTAEEEEPVVELERGWTPLGNTPIKLGLGPANYAGQLAAFAQAITRERADVSAEVVKHRTARTHDYPADVYVEGRALKNLDVQLEQVQRIVPRYTHLIADAFRPVFGGLNGDSIEGDLPALLNGGLKVALLAHGSEVRSPALHKKRNPYSLFLDAPEGYEEKLTVIADRNRRIAEESGLPVFVTTPDLLVDLPMAIWTPLVVDVDAWTCDRPVMERERPVVLHAPSARWTKGTDRILPVLEELHERGLIEFQLAEQVSWTKVREMVMEADIIIDQFAIGTYGTFACEGMAAGKPVVAYLDKEPIEASGVTPPIVNATPETLGSVIEALVADREGTRRLGAESAAFAREYHDGRATAAALDSFLTP